MTGLFVIRRAHRPDAGALSEFAARLFRATYSSDTAASDLESYIHESFGLERQAAEIADPSGAVFLATSDDLIVGYAHVIVGPADACSALLNRIYVDSDWRGGGLANHLLEAVLGECERRNVVRLELTVFERNVRAIAFYKRAGFAAIARTTFTVGEDMQTDLVMQMDLAERFGSRSI